MANKINNNIKLISIALIIVLSVILVYGLFNFSGRNILPDVCTPTIGYVCHISYYNRISGSISVFLGQNSGANWTTANFVFVPNGTQIVNYIPSISFIGYPSNSISNVKSGDTIKIWLPVNWINPPVVIGTPAKGTIWVQYTTCPNGQLQYAQIATIYIRAS